MLNSYILYICSSGPELSCQKPAECKPASQVCQVQEFCFSWIQVHGFLGQKRTSGLGTWSSVPAEAPLWRSLPFIREENRITGRCSARSCFCFFCQGQTFHGRHFYILDPDVNKRGKRLFFTGAYVSDFSSSFHTSRPFLNLMILNPDFYRRSEFMFRIRFHFPTAVLRAGLFPCPG